MGSLAKVSIRRMAPLENTIQYGRAEPLVRRRVVSTSALRAPDGEIPWGRIFEYSPFACWHTPSASTPYPKYICFRRDYLKVVPLRDDQRSVLACQAHHAAPPPRRQGRPLASSDATDCSLTKLRFDPGARRFRAIEAKLRCIRY